MVAALVTTAKLLYVDPG